MSDSLRPHESQHARPPGPSPTPGVQGLLTPPLLPQPIVEPLGESWILNLNTSGSLFKFLILFETQPLLVSSGSDDACITGQQL